MAAGLGFKTFAVGEVLTAADTNGYLMQGVLVFASAAARDAAITSPQEGQFAYLKDTNVTTYYTGSAWANLDTTGMVNPMTTTGDTIYSSSGSTPARLGIGSTGQVLTVAGGVPSWATPAGGTPSFVGCMFFKGASQTLSNNTFTAITFAETDYLDTDGFHDPSTNNTRITIPSGKAGKYLVNGYILNDTGINSARTRIYLNGTAFYETRYALAGDDNGMGVSIIMDLTVGDYIELYGYQNTGGNNAVYGSTDLGIKATSFGVQYLGA